MCSCCPACDASSLWILSCIMSSPDRLLVYASLSQISRSHIRDLVMMPIAHLPYEQLLLQVGSPLLWFDLEDGVHSQASWYAALAYSSAALRVGISSTAFLR